MVRTNKPQFPDDRRIEMTAYMGPRRAGKRMFFGKYGENPRDPKEGYPSFFTDDVFELYKNAGFSFLMPEGDAYFGNVITPDGFVKESDFEKSDLYTYMKMAEKHGLDVYPAADEIFGRMTHEDGPFGEEEKAIVRNFVTTVQEYCPKSFKGIMLTDEPKHYAVGRMKKIVEYLYSDEIVAIKPDIKFFSSMLPMYASIEAFHPDYAHAEGGKVTFDEERERAYQHYIDICADALGEFGMDYYALGRDGWLSPVFYRNLEMMAESGRQGNYPISVTLLSCHMDTKYEPKTGRGVTIFRAPSYEDMCWQVYSALAFGVQSIGYFTFWQHYSESHYEVFRKAMINYDPSSETGYRKTEIYDAVAEVNRQILAIDHIFLRYQWVGCKVVRVSRDRNIRTVKGGYEGGLIQDVKASKDTLIGCFVNPEDQSEGYWLVNADNPYRYEMNDVEIAFEGATKLVYYRQGKEYEASLENGRFTIRLGVGEGIFMIPYQE